MSAPVRCLVRQDHRATTSGRERRVATEGVADHRRLIGNEPGADLRHSERRIDDEPDVTRSSDQICGRSGKPVIPSGVARMCEERDREQATEDEDSARHRGDRRRGAARRPVFRRVEQG